MVISFQVVIALFQPKNTTMNFGFLEDILQILKTKQFIGMMMYSLWAVYHSGGEQEDR
jgi:hypothetical protein